MNVLVVDRLPPCDMTEGNALLGWHLFRHMRGHRLTLVCPAPAHQEAKCREQLSHLFERVHLVPRERPAPALVGLLERDLAKVRLADRLGLDAAAAAALASLVRSLAAGGEYDVIHVRQLPMPAAVRGIRHPCMLFELIDSETLQSARRMARRSARGVARYWLARVLERKAVRQFAAVTTVAEADAAMVRRIAPGVPVHVVPNGVDAEHFAPMDMAEEPNTLLFFGAMSFAPNVDAAVYLCRTILPAIRELNPRASVVIAGRDPSPEVQALARDPAVTVTGRVDDMRTYLARASVVVCPMVSGSGIKNKVLEALAMARPVVSTPLGVEALDVVPGRDVVVARSPDEFARESARLLADSDARRAVGQAGRALVMARYTWQACADRYVDLYRDLVERAAARQEKATLANRRALDA